MKLHLPVRLFKSIFACLSVASLTAGSGMAWAEVQNLVFKGDTLVWNTQTEAFEDADAAAAAFAAGDNVSFESDATVSLGEDIIAGQVSIGFEADVIISPGDFSLDFDTLSLQGGSLEMEPMLSLAAGQTFAVGSNGSVLKSDLSLADDATLRVDFSGSGAVTDMNDSTLTLHGGSFLQLENCGLGDGRTYTLLSGISGLRDKDGNALTLDSSNNAASLYFDTTQPGTGFWADATLQLSDDGSLQLVRYRDISLPDGYTEVSVDDMSDISYYKSDSLDLAFRLTKGLTIVGNSSSLMSSSAGSWCFISASVDSLASLSFSNAMVKLFDVASDKKLEFIGLQSVAFIDNTDSPSGSTYYYGGAIYGSSITMSDNGCVEFIGNTTCPLTTSFNKSLALYGGAIYSRFTTLNGNGCVMFCENKGNASSSSGSTTSSGGAICSTITMSDNGSVIFTKNSATSTSTSSSGSGSSDSYGGAISGSIITLNGNGSVEFSGNTASSSSDLASSTSYGGGINGSTIELTKNGTVMFNGNTASSSSFSASPGVVTSRGGAIYGESDSTITLTGNGNVEFLGNKALASSFDYTTGKFSSYGGAIYGGVITLNENGGVKFIGNSAITTASKYYATSYGGAIYGRKITLDGNSSVEFIGNTVSATTTYTSNDSHKDIDGGSISGSTIMLHGNGRVEFRGNSVSGSLGASYGGAIYGSTIELTGNGSVDFTANIASSSVWPACGGAIYGKKDGMISLNENIIVTFSGNETSSDMNVACGGAIYGGDNSTITLSENGSVEFIENRVLSSTEDHVDICGGAIYGGIRCTMSMSGNDCVEVRGNKTITYAPHASAEGGAFYVGQGSTLELGSNTIVSCSGNESYSYGIGAHGGVIYGATNSTVTLSKSKSVIFERNVATAINAGGGVMAGYGTITVSNNDSVIYKKNEVSASHLAYGGAIYGGEIMLCGNKFLKFQENSAISTDKSSAYGGAVYGYGMISLRENTIVEFFGNTAVTAKLSSTSGGEASACGGAINGTSNSEIMLIGNGSVVFQENNVFSNYASGGAIYGENAIRLEENDRISFVGNTAQSDAKREYCYARGGAIYGEIMIELRNNESVEFLGNNVSSSYASVRGGAVYSSGSVTIAGNDEVAFAQNVEKSYTTKSYSTYRLRSLYINCANSTDKLTLSAGKGKSIRFYDSVYMGASGSVVLNADYTDADGVTQKASGTILFSGATTEDDLKTVKGGVAGTEEEISLSRTSEINSAATLYGGTLQVQDKAVLKLNAGLTVAEGSRAAVQVRAAELNLGGKALNMVAGSSLELTDGARLTNTSLTIATDATLTVRGVTSTVSAETQVAALTMSRSMVEVVATVSAANAGSVCVLDGDLTLESGSRICFDGAYLELTGDLVFDVESGAEKIALEISPGLMMDDAGPLALFSVGGTVTFSMDGQPAVPDGDQVYTIKATDYFIGSMLSESTTLVYDAVNNVMYLEGVANVPEPATTMLGLVGMVVLNFRRRRK